MSDILVSSFKNAKDVHPVNATLESILDAIRSTRLQAQIGRLRHTLQTAGKAAYNAQKIAPACRDIRWHVHATRC